MQELQQKVVQWAQEKGLLANVTPERIEAQTLKVIEEIGETAGAYLKGNQEELIDGIGDIGITVIILAAMRNIKLRYRQTDPDMANLIYISGCISDSHIQAIDDDLLYGYNLLHQYASSKQLSFFECLESAYLVISKRKGKMFGDTFVKD